VNRGRKPRSWWPTDTDGCPVETLSEDQAKRLRERASNLCIWHLAQGPRTRAQLREAMVKHAVPGDMADEVLADMERYGYVNDAAYAEGLVRSRTVHGLKARRAIGYELARKGVDREVAATALAEVSDETEAENAVALARKKARTVQGLPEQKQIQRIVGMLARRGYGSSVAYAAAREAVQGP